MRILKNPSFFSGFLGGTVAALLVVAVFSLITVVFGWTDPSGAPPGGSGFVSVDSNGNVGVMGGNLGVGVTPATSKLDVAGGVTVGGGYVGNAAPVDGMIIQGNVGIGTNNPTALLDVGGALNVTGTGLVGIGGSFTALNALDISGGVVIGSGYAGAQTALSDGLDVEGTVRISANTSSVVSPGGFGTNVLVVGNFNEGNNKFFRLPVYLSGTTPDTVGQDKCAGDEDLGRMTVNANGIAAAVPKIYICVRGDLAGSYEWYRIDLLK